MKRLSQSNNTECCSGEGKAEAPLEGAAAEQPLGSVHRELRGPQAGVAPRQSNSASKLFIADGESVLLLAPETEGTVEGEVLEGLPASKSVASEERACGNLGGPLASGRSNCENQPGRLWQPKEAQSRSAEGFRSAHSSAGQPPAMEADLGEGADKATKLAQETGAVRKTEQSWRTSLRAIAKKAVQERKHRFGGLYRLLNHEGLKECFFQLRKDAACGVDGVTFQEYERELESNLKNLVGRLKNKGYHAKLVRRQYIPKENGKLRPLGIPALEDKLVQLAAAQILLAIYEADFLPCSYGYRPNRGAKDAVRALTDALHPGRHEFVVEADIKGFFDHIQHDWMLRMLGERISDGAMLRLIEKWLKAGILEPDGKVVKPESGTPQGGIISPVLANVYLHYVLDLWFEHRVRKANQGGSQLFRYADDFVACFGYRHEAEAFQKALEERLKKFGLELAKEKTKTLRFGRGGGKHNGRFDFLGFEFYWEKGRKGFPIIKRRTSPKKLESGLKRLKEWIRNNRSRPIGELMKTLRQKFQGYWNYYGVIGNSSSLKDYQYRASRIVFKWLNRRSQKRSCSWKRFNRLLVEHRVPPPRITEGNRKRPEQLCQPALTILGKLGLASATERYWKLP